MNNDEKTVVQFKNAEGITQTSRPVAGGFARPNPGGRSAPPPVNNGFGATAAATAQNSPPAGFNNNQPLPGPASVALPLPVAAGYGLDNPLLAAAEELLSKMAQLAARHETQDVLAFRDWCTRQIQGFEQRCLQQDVAEEARHYARYVLCTVMDELVNKTPWGIGVWSKQSLLSQFHGETGGGERFFQLLEYLQQTPAKNLPLLELMFVCLGLGFEGKFSLDARGYAHLEELRDNLFHLIRMQRGEPERDLSPHWQRVTTRRNPLTRYLPLWVVVAVVGVIMLATFSGFSYLLNERSSAILSQLENRGQPLSSRVDPVPVNGNSSKE
ncbi:type IVB secretion system protein IcmH/DotU [Ketobacter sp.]